MSRLSRWAIAIALLLTGLAMARMGQNVRTDRTLDSLFAPDDPVLADYLSLRRDFGGNEVVLLVYDDPQLWTAAGVATNRLWAAEIAAAPCVDSVLSVARLCDAFAVLRPSFFGGDIKLLDDADPLAVDFRGLFEGYTHGANGRTAGIVAMLDPAQKQLAGRQLRAVANRMPPAMQPALVGEPVLIGEAFEAIERDGRFLAISVAVVLALTLAATMRDVRAVALSAIAVGWTVAATHAAAVVMDWPFSIIASILTAIITVIVVGAVVHLASAARRLGWPAGLVAVAMPITASFATDAAGFGSLMASSIAPVRQFGGLLLVAAVAAGISVLAGAVVLWSPKFREPPTLVGTAKYRSLRWGRAAWVVAVVAIPLGGWAAARSTPSSSFLDNFDAADPVVVAYRRVEQDLGGAGVADLTIALPGPPTDAMFEQIERLQRRLAEMGQTGGIALSKILSIVDADRIAARSPTAGLLPIGGRLAGMRAALGPFSDALITPPDHPAGGLRIMLRAPESITSTQRSALLAEIDEIANDWQSENPKFGRPVLTGSMVLMSRLLEGLVADQWRTFALATAAVGGLLWLWTGSIFQAIAATACNVLPITTVLGIASTAGVSLDLGAAMIGAVSIGLSIDGSIHLLTAYRRGISGGLTAVDAAGHAVATTGRAIIVSAASLAIGFAVLLASDFGPTATFGGLVAACLAASAAVNLLMLPAMLVSLRTS